MIHKMISFTVFLALQSITVNSSKSATKLFPLLLNDNKEKNPTWENLELTQRDLENTHSSIINMNFPTVCLQSQTRYSHFSNSTNNLNWRGGGQSFPVKKFEYKSKLLSLSGSLQLLCRAAVE
jgi:hypothetical protein